MNECVVTDLKCIAILKELIFVKKGDDHVMMYQEGPSWHHIKHTDVNSFLKSYGNTISSKDFRTFQANVMLIDLLKNSNPVGLKPTARKKLLNESAVKVSEEIHNTVAICKKDYIDPEIIELFLDHPISYRSKFITPASTPRILFMNWLKSKCL